MTTAQVESGERQVRSLAHGLKANAVTDPSLVTQTKVAGRDVLQFPVKALKEMVLKCMTCSPGGEFVSAAEIRKTVQAWKGIPVTINHPMGSNGYPRYAEESDRVGTIVASRWTDDGWLVFDVEVDRALLADDGEGAGILNALKTGVTDVEVSTGYETFLNIVEGVHNGARYFVEQTNLKPDHLALLPLGVPGACSVKDGCGAARMNRGGGSMTRTEMVLEALRAILRLGDESPGPDEAQGSETAAGEAEMVAATSAKGEEAPDAEETKDNGEEDGGSPQSEETVKMNRGQVIAALAAAASVPFTEEQLEPMADEQLKSLADLAGVDCGCGKPTANSGGEPGTEGRSNEGTEDGGAEGGAEGEAQTQPQGIDVDALVSSIVGKVREELAPALALAQNAKRQYEAEKAEVIAGLVANESCRVSEEALKGMDLETLKDLAHSFGPQDFSGLALPRPNAGRKVEEAYTPAPPAILASTSN